MSKKNIKGFESITTDLSISEKELGLCKYLFTWQPFKYFKQPLTYSIEQQMNGTWSLLYIPTDAEYTVIKKGIKACIKNISSPELLPLIDECRKHFIGKVKRFGDMHSNGNI